MRPTHILLTALILTALLCAAPVAAAAASVSDASGTVYTTYDQIYASTTLSSSEKLSLVQEMAGWTPELEAYMEWKNSGGLEAYQAAVSGGISTSGDYGWDEAPGDGLGDGSTSIEPEYSYQERQAYDAAYDAYQAEFAENYAATAAYTGSGSGTQADPYIITSPVEWAEINNDLSANYKLGADINLGTSWQPTGTTSTPFRGIIDGDGHKITLIGSGQSGCFLTITSNSVVKNTHFIRTINVEPPNAVSCYIIYSTASYVGTIQSCIFTDTAIDISLSNKVIAPIDRATVLDCIANVNYNIFAVDYISGININGNVNNCYVIGAIHADTVRNIGGITARGDYGYSGPFKNTISSSVSLLTELTYNTFTGGSYSNEGNRRARIGAATYNNNYALDTMQVSWTLSTGVNARDGANVNTATYQTQAFWQDTLGWDFNTVWYWDDTDKLPKLQVFKKSVPPTISSISATPSIGGQQDTYTLSVSASTTASGGIASYQWYGRIGSSGEWQAISDGTSATYQFVPGAYTLGDFYFKCVVTGADGGVIDSYDVGFTNVKITVVLAPQITSPAATPASGPLTQTITLSADVTSTETVTYQWQELIGSTWTDISGATAATATVNINDASPTTHTYRLQATNVGGTSTSNTVTYQSVAAPTISSVTSNPTTGPLTQSVTLTATVSGATSYQWQQLSGSTWQNIAGATSATYTVSIADTTATTHTYRLQATNVGGTTTSATVTYQSVAAPTINTISASPASGPLTQTVTLSATVTSTETVTYQWQELIGSTWTDISGATAATATVNIADSAATTHTYRLQATNVGGTTTSATITYTSVAPPTISSVTANPTTGPLTQSVTLSATVSGATSYQWQQQSGSTWQNIAGATAATYTVSINDANPTTHSYRLQATNIGGTSTSATVTYTSVAAPTITAATANPTSGPLTQTVTLTVSATGASNYQWQEQIGGNWQNIAGATTATHDVSISDSTPTLHTYRVIVSNVGGSTTSDTVTYQSSTGPIINTISATPTSGPLTQTVQLSVTANSANTISYQWQELIGSAWTNIQGATTPTYSVSITDTNPTTHRYRVLATDVGGTTPSETITYTSIAPPNIQGANINPAIGKYTETITLSAEVSGADTYQWQQNTGSGWQNIAGATTVPWIGTLTVSGDTQYRLLATNAGGTTTSSPIQYTIAGPANIQSLTATPSVVAIPGSTTLQITGTNIVYVEWQKLSGSTWQTIGTGVSLTESITNVGETTFRALVEGADGTTTTSNNIVVLSGYAPSVDITEPINGDEFGVGNTITAQATVTGTDVLFEWGFGVNGVGNLNTNPTTITYTSQGYKTITITAESIFGTATDSVTILYGKAPRPMQTELFEEVDTTPVTNFVNQFDVEPGEMPNPVGIVASLFAPFDDALKGFFWVLMFGAVMLVVWLISKNIAIPSVLGILFGSFMIGFMPDIYLYPAVALIAAGCAGGLVYVVRKN